MSSCMDFSKRLIDLRESKNLKQKDLAVVVGLQSGAISKYEKRITEPSLKTLIKLAGYFGVSVDYLLGLSSNPNPYAVGELSPKEADIIFKYRKLSSEQQIRIDERMNAMLDMRQSTE